MMPNRRKYRRGRAGLSIKRRESIPPYQGGVGRNSIPPLYRGPEFAAPRPDPGRPVRDRLLEMGRHTPTTKPCAWRRDRPASRNRTAGIAIERRGAHQPDQVGPEQGVAGGDGRVRELGPPDFCGYAGVDLQPAGADESNLLIHRRSSASARRGRSRRLWSWRRRAAPPRAPCWSASRRSDVATAGAPHSRRAGKLRGPDAILPKRGLPSTQRGSRKRRVSVLETAIRVMSSGRRLARSASLGDPRTHAGRTRGTTASGWVCDMDRRLLDWARAVKARRHGRIPVLWLFTDAQRLRNRRGRGGAARRGGGCAITARDADRLARRCRARGLALVVAGDPRLAARLGAGQHLRDGRLPRPGARGGRGASQARLRPMTSHRCAGRPPAGPRCAFLSPSFQPRESSRNPGIGPRIGAAGAGGAALPVAGRSVGSETQRAPLQPGSARARARSPPCCKAGVARKPQCFPIAMRRDVQPLRRDAQVGNMLFEGRAVATKAP